MVSFLTKGCTVTYFEIKKKDVFANFESVKGGGGEAPDKQIDEMLQDTVFFYSYRR